MTFLGIDWLGLFTWINQDLFAWPGVILFLGSALILTVKTKFIQIWGFPKFLRIITQQTRTQVPEQTSSKQTITPLRALFTALGTSIGMGNVVGPSVAVMKGGPGALFWLVLYIFFASVTKFAEVTFAVHTREKTADGHIIGGPMEYLRKVNPWIACWYGGIMSILFACWSGNQSNNLAKIYAIESVPEWAIGSILAILVFIVVQGGAQRIGALASKLVPLMFVLYVSFALFILLGNPSALYSAIASVFNHACTPAAAMGGFLGCSVFTAIRYGAFRGIYISESGLGTASIPHAMADTKRPTDQGLLAMGSTVADITLSIISGLLVLVTGIWMQGGFRNTPVYEVFKTQTPMLGQFVLLISFTLFVFTTVIGNSFNGIQSFSSLTGHRWAQHYLLVTVCIIFVGAFMSVPLIWEILDFLMFLAAVPNLLGILYLAFKYPQVLRVKE